MAAAGRSRDRRCDVTCIRFFLLSDVCELPDIIPKLKGRILLKNGRKPLKNYEYVIKLTQWIFLTLPVTVATGERSFSKLKLIKTYLQSNTSQERLVGLATTSIEMQNTDIENIMQDFADKKAKEVIM
ncbi:hypothetical protein AVEN_169561-1 [Araneus ventricosus]|uniref:HAT C-terminal dimerisation domain-containing protein n=1 Tax=Araneus ventricosus TaxID=182803 RepID=A0A4Y2MZK2_ARAVE|nr:hypothetical protein AVEN_169561-1 [Araneus ventricosus]